MKEVNVYVSNLVTNDSKLGHPEGVQSYFRDRYCYVIRVF